jgi:Putative zinc-finger
VNIEHETNGCEVIRADLHEFALGTLSGRPRSRVIDHLTSCAQCRTELQALTSVADALLTLAPQSEPPWGFEQRLIDRYRNEVAPARRHPRWRPLMLSAAAALLVALGFSIGALVQSPHSTPAASGPPSAVNGELTSQGHSLGHVFIVASNPSWIYMTFDDPQWSGTAWCRVTLRSGRVRDLGSFTMTDGYGVWSAATNVPVAQIKSAQVVNAHGVVLASATLTS